MNSVIISIGVSRSTFIVNENGLVESQSAASVCLADCIPVDQNNKSATCFVWDGNKCRVGCCLLLKQMLGGN